MSSLDAQRTGHVPRFFLHQKVTPIVNRYRVLLPDGAGEPGDLLALAEQKRMKLREEVGFFADEAKRRPVFSFKSRQVLDLAATTDIMDAEGATIATFKKDVKASLLRSTWLLHYGEVEARGQESSLAIALVRRVVDLPLRFHFEFVDPASGAVVMTVERQRSLRDRYAVEVADPRLDVRVAAAMAVALDAFQGR